MIETREVSERYFFACGKTAPSLSFAGHWSVIQWRFSWVGHNWMMRTRFQVLLVCVFLGIAWMPLAWGQSSSTESKSADSSKQVEQQEDSYRRQMELEDARSKDRTYVDTTYTDQGNLEKIDKLPPESRENIRDQLVDIIMENGDWEPGDVLGEYPYAPTEAAEADPELKEQEMAAWEEQVEKYHEREAQAFGSYRGPVPGPGNPGGQEGGEQGEGSQGQQGGGQDGSEGKSSARSAGTYQPYQPGSSSSQDEVSTAGVSESALDFLRGGHNDAREQPQEPAAAGGSRAQMQAQSQAQDQAESQSSESQDEQANEVVTEQFAQQSPQQDSEQAEAEQQQESPADVQPDTRGIIAIEDLNKLEGTQALEESEDSGQP